MLQRCMSCKNRIIWLNNSSGDLRRRIDGKLQLGLLSIINRKTLHKKRSEARTSATTKRVEDQKALKSLAVVGDTTNAVQNWVDNFLSNSVMSASIVIGCILFPSDQLLWMEELLSAPNPPSLHEERAVHFQSQRRKSKTSHPAPIVQKAYDHLAEFHALSNKAPNKHFQFELQLGQHEWK
uniref:Uncharacterized protein n=2 Tax=Meloidogyne incognita TaxID=6306 RepID=A0A914MPQ2_MELIC